MKQRTFNIYNELQHFNIGPFRVKQPLPNSKVEQLSPFLLLHHAGPTDHQPGEIKARLSPHPHRGFEPVTFLFSGKIHHKDSTGSEGLLESGDVQWMTSGSGIIHSEGPSEAFAKEGGTMELIQLWINLPRKHKMTSPKYQDIKKSSMPVINVNGFRFHLVAGEFHGEKGPAQTFTPITAMTAEFTAGATASIPVNAGHHVIVYVLEGEVETNGGTLGRFHIGLSDDHGEVVELRARSAGKLLFLTGEPIEEPVASHGPFVMNYPGEIKQAIMDYHEGKMGVLES